MTDIQRNILIGFGTVIIGIPMSGIVGGIIGYIFFVDNGYCDEYRFPKLSWLLDFFYGGYHHDGNTLSFLLTLIFGFYITNRLIKYSLKLIIRIKNSRHQSSVSDL